jgi:hypothetical protein
LAVWLFLSAFMWAHTPNQMMVTGILGLLIALSTMAALVNPSLRPVTIFLAIQLLLVAILLPRVSPGTAWNNAAVALGILVVSCAPPGSR